jgi:hypothetical protein
MADTTRFKFVMVKRPSARECIEPSIYHTTKNCQVDFGEMTDFYRADNPSTPPGCIWANAGVQVSPRFGTCVVLLMHMATTDGRPIGSCTGTTSKPQYWPDERLPPARSEPLSQRGPTPSSSALSVWRGAVTACSAVAFGRLTHSFTLWRALALRSRLAWPRGERHTPYQGVQGSSLGRIPRS